MSTEVAELFFATRKRHMPDIYECRMCCYQFPHEAECPKCGSANIRLFMRAPSRAQMRLHNPKTREEALTELDPDWRERFHGDDELAADFYGYKP